MMKTVIDIINTIQVAHNMTLENTVTRVFIVGCPRSGTTLLQSLLAANSYVESFPESHFFEKLFSGRPLLSVLGIASRSAKPRWKIILNDLGHPELTGILPQNAVSVRQYVDAFVRVLDTLTLNHGKSVWIEKTPGHVQYVSQIENLVGNVRFIHIIRTGVENIASLYEVSKKYPETWGEWYGTIDQCIQRWVDDVRRSMECSLKDNHKAILYSQLVDAPEKLLVELCQFIAVPFEENMLTDYTKSASQLILNNEEWKSSVYESIKKQRESKFRSVFNDEQQLYILSCIPKDLLGIALPGNEQIK